VREGPVTAVPLAPLSALLKKMEVIRKLIPRDVWAAIAAAIVVGVFAIVNGAPLPFFLVVALALCAYTAKILSESDSH
jgi:type III secretory pathway component EscV